jgi:peptidoglycan/xylan/chitin deacetylase (PgdA/CDA1 family)
VFHLKKAFYGLSAVLFAAIISFPVILPTKASAAIPSNLSRVPKITFTFDDGLLSARSLAAQTLQTYNYTGVNYVASSCIGMTTAPNTCQANTDGVYMTWAQVNELQDTYGWEIGSHTSTHPYLATSGDEQPNPLTNAQVINELTTSRTAIATNTGIAPTAFASPYGDYQPNGNPVLAEVAKLYTSHRGFADTGYNVSPWETTATLPADNYPLNNYLIRTQQVQAGVSVATVQSYIDKAIADNAWLVLTFHDITAGAASTNPDDYQYSNADLATIAAYARSKNVLGTNVSNGLALMSATGTNLLPNSSFDSAIGTFDAANPSTTTWTTDNPSVIKQDTGNHGNYPSSTNSISVTDSSTATHLFSPIVSVTAGQTYICNMFINVTTVTSGEVAFYIDEYDATGTYLTTQYKKSIFPSNNPLVKNWNFSYVPTTGAAKARLQVYFAANSGVAAYIDNAQLFAADDSIVTPPQPTYTAGDLNHDGKVDALDLSTLLTNWGQPNKTAADGNINGDTAVDALDLSTLLANWSK